MKFLKKERWLIIIIALLAAFSVKALAIPHLYTSHDGETHTARLANYYLALKEGQMPPQLAPTLFGGYGFPIFVFIYPLPYLVGSFFHWLGFTYTDATELTIASGQVVSAVAIYLFFKLETKKTVPSFLGALFFTWAPYRFLMIFVRGAFAESFAYIFIATSLICLNRLIETRKTKWVGWTSLSLAGLLLSHQLVSVMSLPVLTWYVFSKLIFTKKHKKEIITKTVFSLILAFTTAAFIYGPSFFERKYLHFDSLISYHNDHFVTIKQLIRSPWSYGFSHPGTENDDMSFQIGLTHLVVIALSSWIALKTLVRTKKKFFSKPENVYLLFWLFAFVMSVFLMVESPYAKWTWKHVPGVDFVDFPWRFIGVATIATSMLTAYVLKKINSNIFIVAFLLFFVFYANRNHLRINEPLIRDDGYFTYYPATATWRNEFLPIKRISSKWEGIEGDYQVAEGEAQITEVVNKTQEVQIDVDVTEKATILIHRMYYPGWEVYLNGEKLDRETSDIYNLVDSYIDVQDTTDYSSFLKLALEPGEYNIKAQFEPTLLRRNTQLLSVLGLVISLAIITKPKLFTDALKLKN